jgi:hypothetical protein
MEVLKSVLIHAIDQFAKGLIDKLALDLHGGRNFSVFLVEFFGQDAKLFNLFDSCQRLVHRFDFILNQLANIIVQRQIFVS